MTMYSDTIFLVAGDNLPFITFALKDSNTAASGAVLDPNDPTTWAPIDVTGATVRLRLRLQGSSTIHATLTCVLVDPDDGVVATDFPDGVLSAAGTYEGEIEITFGDDSVQTVYELVRFKVRAEFGT